MVDNVIRFQYDPLIIQRFPKLAGGVMSARNLVNKPTPENLQKEYYTEQQRILEKIGSQPLSEIDTLAGWRTAFRSFGVDPTGYRNAAEALLRRLTKKGGIPSINAIVDCCNLVSIRYGLPVAAVDLRDISGVILVKFASGDERFVNLGHVEDDLVNKGEVIFIDEAGLVIARRWCWRQSEESSAREDTRQALFTVEAQNDGGRALVARACADLRNLLLKYVGGEFTDPVVLP